MGLFKAKVKIVEAFLWTGSANQSECPEWFEQYVNSGRFAVNTDDHGVYIYMAETRSRTYAPVWIVHDFGQLRFPADDMFWNQYDKVEVAIGGSK